jgi:DNA (cytosine-5)-methyltransferase 1
MTGSFNTVISSEIDPYACKTYKHLFKVDPQNDLTTQGFKNLVTQTAYDILLAGFPCQPFSRAGLGEGFDDESKGGIFFHIVRIIKKTRPAVIFLENVDHLVTRENGETFKHILKVLEISLKYKIIGVQKAKDDTVIFNSKDFIRNSKNFGIPQNRPRAYIIGFDRKLFGDKIEILNEIKLPETCPTVLYKNLNSILEKKVDPHYYLGSGYLETLKRHREREKKKGNNFGYKVINEPDIINPIANTLLATGGSGRERNLIYDPRPGIGGIEVKNKKTPLNNEGIRIMTPREWGKLQGFINYAFLENGKDTFSFPDTVPELHQYRQFGNSVTIPVIKTMAEFILKCLKKMDYSSLRRVSYQQG